MNTETILLMLKQKNKKTITFELVYPKQMSVNEQATIAEPNMHALISLTNTTVNWNASLDAHLHIMKKNDQEEYTYIAMHEHSLQCWYWHMHTWKRVKTHIKLKMNQKDCTVQSSEMEKAIGERKKANQNQIQARK